MDKLVIGRWENFMLFGKSHKFCCYCFILFVYFFDTNCIDYVSMHGLMLMYSKTKQPLIKTMLLKKIETMEDYNLITKVLKFLQNTQINDLLLDDLKVIRECYDIPFYLNIHVKEMINLFFSNRDPFFVDLWYETCELASRLNYNNCPNIPELAKVIAERSPLNGKQHEKPFFTFKSTFCQETKQSFEKRENLLYFYFALANPKLKH